jgi:hypothetical protein
MSNNSLVLSTFNKQLDECIQDIMTAYPNLTLDDPRFIKFKAYFETLKSSNPRLIILTWKTKVNDKYRAQIDAGDIDFFITKSYNGDVQELTNEVENAINDLRRIIGNMSKENIVASMKYIQNLCKLCDHYII